jgi:RHS repeat-associated protein
VWRWDSDPFGTTAANEDPDGDAVSFAYELRFPGQYYDGEMGLNYNYYRDYDPATGRYVQSDPIGLEGGVNTFAYANSNPVTYFDALGSKVGLRCRSVGALGNPGVKGSIAAMLGGEHCYLVVSCESEQPKIPKTTISYLGPVSIAQGGVVNNDTQYSDVGAYRDLIVFPQRESESKCNKDGCKFERCLLDEATTLNASGYRMSNYSIWGPNSNSFVRRLVEKCGGLVFGAGPPTGWEDAGKVGF